MPTDFCRQDTNGFEKAVIRFVRTLFSNLFFINNCFNGSIPARTPFGIRAGSYDHFLSRDFIAAFMSAVFICMVAADDTCLLSFRTGRLPPPGTLFMT